MSAKKMPTEVVPTLTTENNIKNGGENMMKVSEKMAELRKALHEQFVGMGPNEAKARSEKIEELYKELTAAELQLAEGVDGPLADLEGDVLVWVAADYKKSVFSFLGRSVSEPRELDQEFTWIGYVGGKNQRYHLGSYNTCGERVYCNHHDHENGEDLLEMVRLVEHEGKAYLVCRTYQLDESDAGKRTLKADQIVRCDDERLVDNLPGEDVREIWLGERIIHTDGNYAPDLRYTSEYMMAVPLMMEACRPMPCEPTMSVPVTCGPMPTPVELVLECDVSASMAPPPAYDPMAPLFMRDVPMAPPPVCDPMA